MTTFDAVYRGGVLHPTTPLDLPDDTPVRVTVEPSTTPPPTAPDPAAVLARIQAIAAKVKRTGVPERTSENVDAILYGRPGDPGDVR